MEAHGYLDLGWSGNVLNVRAVGPFNEEGAKAAAAAYLDAIRNRPQPVFAVVEALDENAMGPPETMGEVAKIWRHLGKQGCKALALVFANEVQRQLAEQHLPKFGRAFGDREEAEAWARSRLPDNGSSTR